VLLGAQRPTPAVVDTRSSYKEKVETMLTPALRDSVGFEIGAGVAEVNAVFTSVVNGACYVWTVVSEFTPRVRRTIYGKEKSLIDRFHDLSFEFNIVAARGQDPMSVIRDETLELAFLRR
jgi:hypothetical protein